MPTQKKKEIVAKLIKQLKRAEAIYFTNYQGLSHQELEQLRNKIKEQNADYTIVKNTLFNLALKTASNSSQASHEMGRLALESDAVQLTGPTAVLFAYENPIKPLQTFTQNFKDRVKAAIAFGEYLTDEKLQKLVGLESKEILQTKLVSQLASPLYELAYALNWNLQRLAIAIGKISNLKLENGYVENGN